MAEAAVVSAGDAIYAASADGEVHAFNRMTGKRLWDQELETALSGGVGVYDNALLLGTSDGYVVQLDASNGEQRWSTRLTGEILAPPQGDGRYRFDIRLQGAGDARHGHFDDVRGGPLKRGVDGRALRGADGL